MQIKAITLFKKAQDTESEKRLFYTTVDEIVHGNERATCDVAIYNCQIIIDYIPADSQKNKKLQCIKAKIFR